MQEQIKGNGRFPNHIFITSINFSFSKPILAANLIYQLDKPKLDSKPCPNATMAKRPVAFNNLVELDEFEHTLLKV